MPANGRGEPHRRLSEAFVSGGLDRAIDTLIENLDEAAGLWLGQGADVGVTIHSREAVIAYLCKHRSDWRPDGW